MEKIIQKAIEGGWKSHDAEVMLLHNLTPQVTVDILFWQALSAACGWGIQIKDYKGDIHVNHQYNNGKCTELCIVPSVKIALRFHEINLTQSWEAAVKYLEDLIEE